MLLAQPLPWLLTVSLSAMLSASWAMKQDQAPMSQSTKRPNIVFILSDDQDLHMDSLSYMPHLKRHITDQGTSFVRHYCTVALCCPSRVNLWTGKAAHNTNVTDVNPPYGGYPKFISQGFNDAYLPLWLQDAGYNTYYVGKLFNAQTVDNYASPHAAGWTGSEFLLDPYTYEYLNATFQRNHDLPRSYPGQYSTDLVAEKAFGFLNDAMKSESPFFLTIAPTAPHSNVHIKERLIDGNFSEHSVTQSPPVPAERHRHLFQDAVVPRTPHFNPSDPNGVSWISRLPQQNESNIASNDHFYRSRLRALQAVDEMIDSLITRLTLYGILEDTYIVYSTDNGYHIGQHRLQPGKQCAFEEDVNIPLIIRGPEVPADYVTDIVTSHTDLAPTFLSLVGGEIRDDFDGTAIPLHALRDDGVRKRNEHVNIESWGIIMSEGAHGAVLYPNHTYKALRVIGEGYSYLYTVWCSGEHELYDLVHDPYEMHNLYASDDHSQDSSYRSESLYQPMAFGMTPSKTTLAHLIPRLDALLMVLRTCKAETCREPWTVLHPNGKVRTLRDALHSDFDKFYEVQQQKIRFEKCEKGYILESEGPIHVTPFFLLD